MPSRTEEKTSTLRERLASSVAQVLDHNGSQLLGSSFSVSRTGTLVTCFHVVGDRSSGIIIHKRIVLSWPRLQIQCVGLVDASKSQPTMDIAIIKLVDGPTPVPVEVFPLDIRIICKMPLVSFGHRKSDDFQGLFAEAELLGQIQDASGLPMLQIRCLQIGKGMSGAPLLYEQYERVAGMVSEFWSDQHGADQDLGLAVAARTIWQQCPELIQELPSMLAVPREPESGKPLEKSRRSSHEGLEEMSASIGLSLTAAAILLVAEQYADGSWGRTLWRWSGEPFTKDVAASDMVSRTKVKKAITVTAWAAQALFKASGQFSLGLIRNARKFVVSYWNPSARAFGYLYSPHIGTPFIEGSSFFVANARHTASAAKLLEMTDGLSAQVIDSIAFILRSECPGGGWSEQEKRPANTLSTVFVLDCLIKAGQAPKLTDLLPEDISGRVKPAIARGLAWLAEAQVRTSGMWDYENHPHLQPFYTAHVLACAPQLAIDYPDIVNRAVKGLLSHSKGGGIVAQIGGPPHIAATSMVAYGLAKIDPGKYELEIRRLCRFAFTEFLRADRMEKYHIFESVFILFLCQLPVIHRSWWAERVANVVTELDGVLDSCGEWDEFKVHLETLCKQSDLSLNAALESISESPWKG